MFKKNESKPIVEPDEIVEIESEPIIEVEPEVSETVEIIKPKLTGGTIS